MSHKVKEQILNKNNYGTLNKDISVANITLENGRKLVITHSVKRAKKDKRDREKGIEKLRVKLAKEKSVKSQLSPETIRQLLLNTQTSILYSKAKKIKYALPSQMKAETMKIYRLMNVKRNRTPYIIEKF